MEHLEFHPFIHVCKDIKAISEVARQKIKQVLEQSNEVVMALSGGSTPRMLYRDMSETLPDIRNKVTFILGDERLYPLDNEQSNYNMIYHELLHKIPFDHLIRVDPSAAVTTAEDEKQGLAAALTVSNDYEAKLRKHLSFIKCMDNGRVIDIPKIDIVLLGIGSDGHTASIFPGSIASTETERSVSVSFPSPSMNPKVWRVTITRQVIQNARHIIVLATGKDKSWVIKGILSNECPAEPPVSRFLRGCKGEVSFLLDRDAADGI